jgi:hypothetical protein
VGWAVSVLQSTQGIRGQSLAVAQGGQSKPALLDEITADKQGARYVINMQWPKSHLSWERPRRHFHRTRVQHLRASSGSFVSLVPPSATAC